MRGGKLDFNDVANRKITRDRITKYVLKGGDILVTKSSGSSHLVGMPVLFKQPRDGRDYLFSNFTHRIRVDSNRILPEFVLCFLLSPVGRLTIETMQRTTTGLRNLNMKEYLAQEIPLPPLPDQRRIVARIEEFARRVEEALDRLSKLETEFDSLCRAILFDTSDGEPVPTPMRELVRFRQPDVAVSKTEVYHFAGVYSFGRGVFAGPVKSGNEFAYTRLTRLRAGEFVYPKLMAWEGGLGVVPPECDGFVVSPEYPVFEINSDCALPETLDIYFRTPEIWPVLSEISTGTNARRKRLHPSAFLAYEMPLPPMRTQLRLREIKRRVDEMRKRHAKQKAELAALMPSVLAKAFAGELFA